MSYPVITNGNNVQDIMGRQANLEASLRDPTSPCFQTLSDAFMKFMTCGIQGGSGDFSSTHDEKVKESDRSEHVDEVTYVNDYPKGMFVTRYRDVPAADDARAITVVDTDEKVSVFDDERPKSGGLTMVSRDTVEEDQRERSDAIETSDGVRSPLIIDGSQGVINVGSRSSAFENRVESWSVKGEKNCSLGADTSPGEHNVDVHRQNFEIGEGSGGEIPGKTESTTRFELTNTDFNESALRFVDRWCLIGTDEPKPELSGYRRLSRGLHELRSSNDEGYLTVGTMNTVIVQGVKVRPNVGSTVIRFTGTITVSVTTWFPNVSFSQEPLDSEPFGLKLSEASCHLFRQETWFLVHGWNVQSSKRNTCGLADGVCLHCQQYIGDKNSPVGCPLCGTNPVKMVDCQTTPLNDCATPMVLYDFKTVPTVASCTFPLPASFVAMQDKIDMSMDKYQYWRLCMMNQIWDERLYCSHHSLTFNNGLTTIF